MRTKILRFFIWSMVWVLAGTSVTFAQGKKGGVIKYVPSALVKDAKDIPWVVNPKLPLHSERFVIKSSGVSNHAEAIRKYNAKKSASKSSRKLPGAERQVPPGFVGKNRGPLVLSQPVKSTAEGVVDTGTNLTGVEVLNTYFPTWRQELGGMFSPAQLDAVERTFAATDEWLFVRGEDGELQIRNKDEWNYEARFLTILKDSGISFTERQIKQLVGGPGIKGFTLSRYFAIENIYGFIKAHDGHAPRQGIEGPDGKFLRLSELRERARQGDEQAAELAAELEVGQDLSKALSPRGWSEGSPERKIVQALYDASRNTQTHAQFIAVYRKYLAEHDNQSPRGHIRGPDGKSLRLSDLRKRAKAGDAYAAELAAELEVGQGLQHALTNWSEDLPERKIVQELYDASRNTQTPTQFVAVYQKYLAEHDNQSPRMIIRGPDGKFLRLSELRERARQGDEEAARLAAELEVGRALNHALTKWSEDLPERKIVQELYDASRNVAASRSTDQLYQDLVAHIRDYGRYPMDRESSLYMNIYNRLHYYQSTMVDGKYTDPWLQKIYELKTAVQNAPEGKFTLTPDGQGGYTLEIEEPAAEEIDVAAPHQIEEPAPAVPSPHTLRLRITEDIKNMILQVRDQAALERHEFYPWLRSMQQNNSGQIVNKETMDALWALNRALSFDYKTGQNRRAVTYLLQTVNNYVGVLGEDQTLGYFNKLIYRGRLEPGMLPQADKFHVVAEQFGMSWDGDLVPQVKDVNQTYAQAVKRGETPGVFLDGDEDMVTAIGIESRVDIQTVKQDLEKMLKELLPPGFEVRMGLHELGISGRDMTKFYNGYLHVHLDRPATPEEIEDGFLTDISIRLDVKAGRFARGWDPTVKQFYPYSDAKIAENYRTLFDSFLDQEAKDKLDELAR